MIKDTNPMWANGTCILPNRTNGRKNIRSRAQLKKVRIITHEEINVLFFFSLYKIKKDVSQRKNQWRYSCGPVP